jgi:hypothetical protein
MPLAYSATWKENLIRLHDQPATTPSFPYNLFTKSVHLHQPDMPESSGSYMMGLCYSQCRPPNN